MSNKPLDFTVLDDVTSNGGTSSKSSKRWKSRDTNPTVQMSVRMPEEVYDRFRQHCEDDRRTNGEMLEIMMGAYERAKRQSLQTGPAPIGAEGPGQGE